MKVSVKKRRNIIIDRLNHCNMLASMKALPERKGKFGGRVVQVLLVGASMKALPRRKGNLLDAGQQHPGLEPQ